jgi:hypothetical protein
VVLPHVRTREFIPTWICSMYTIPQRETVAGEATFKSCTSKSMCNVLGSLMRSELAKQSVLLSSKTVFMFSIQTASTGPSKMIHLRFSELKKKVKNHVHVQPFLSAEE